MDRNADLCRLSAGPLRDRCPLLVLAAAWTCGLWIGWKNSNGTVILAGITGAVLLFVCIFCRRFRWRKAVAILLAAAALGCLWMRVRIPAWYAQATDPLAGQHAAVRGRVDELVWPDSRCVVLDDITMQNADGNWMPAEGRIRLWVDSVEGTGLQRGAWVEMPMSLSVPAEPSYPMGRNDRLTAMLRDIRLEASAGWEEVRAAEPAADAGWADSMRYRVAAALLHDFDSEDSALLRALTLGDSGSMEDGQREMYARLGISHLLAVSGLHLDILLTAAACIPLLLKRLRRYREGVYRNDGYAISTVFLAFFLLLTGWKASIGRALVMHIFLYVSGYSRRRYAPVQAWAAAFLVLTVLDPRSLLSVGFQLSMASSGALVFFAFRGEANARMPRFLRPAVTTWIVMGSTWPWILGYFRQFAPGAFLVNLAAIPLAELILVSDLAYAAAVLVFPGMTPLLRAVMEPLLEFYGNLLRLADSVLPALTVPLAWGGAAAAAILMMLSLSPKLVQSSRRYRAITALALTAVTVLAVAMPGWSGRIREEDMLVMGGGSRTALLIRGEEGWILAGESYFPEAVETLEIIRAGAPDEFLFTGDDPEELRRWVDGLGSYAEGTQVTVSRRLADAHPDALAAYARREGLTLVIAEEGVEAVRGEYTLHLETFSARSPGAAVHDALVLESEGGRWIYLDPWRLTGEEAFLSEVCGVVAARWSPARSRAVEGMPLGACILADGAEIRDRNGDIPLYNINTVGAVLLRPDAGGMQLLPLGRK